MQGYQTVLAWNSHNDQTEQPEKVLTFRNLTEISIFQENLEMLKM